MNKMKIYFNIFFLFLCFEALPQKVLIRNPVRFLALGNSYTIGQNVSTRQSWPIQLTSYLKSIGIQVNTTKVIAQTRWTTGNLIHAINNANLNKNYNLVFLLIGVNNQYNGISKLIYTDEFEILLKKAIEIAGNKDRVFVLSVPDYGYTPFGESNRTQISKEIDEYNVIKKTISQKYQVVYFDITEISRMGLANPRLVANDNLHPSEEMYRLWVNLISGYLTIQDLNTDLNTVPFGMEVKTKIAVNQEDKIAKLEFSSEKSFKEINIEIYSITCTRLAHFTNKNKITFHYNRPGIYLYRAVINQSLYTGMILTF